MPSTGNGARHGAGSRQSGHAPDSGRRCITDEQRAARLGGLATSAPWAPLVAFMVASPLTAFEGLLLTTNRHSEARDVLLHAGSTVPEGMLANTTDTGSLEYNTADAALWFLHCIGRYAGVTADLDTVAALAPTMDEILDRHLRGTRYGICADPNDGLLRQGDDGLWLFAGFIALINDEFYVVGQAYIFQFDTIMWGWIHLLVGLVVLAAGVGLFSGAVWARIVGVLMAGLAMLIAFAWLTWYPIWVLLLVPCRSR